MKNKKMPIYGVGPVYVLLCLILTLAGCFADYKGMVPFESMFKVKLVSLTAGTVLIITGIILWLYAVIFQRLDEEIKQGRLVTTGVYAIVRNPIYTAFVFVFTGLLVMRNNLWLMILPIIFYIGLTILMKLTEERWLTEKFGEEYLCYCKKVNRVIPWFKKR